MSMAARAFAAMVASVAALAVQAACPPSDADGARLAGRAGEVAWRVDGATQPPVNRPFALLLQLCPASLRLDAVDAVMPEHRHGMNYRPSLQALGDGRWRAEGLLLHMPGRWELRFDVADGDSRERLATALQVR
ncbi:MAG: hypothetical protein MUF03_15455 [Rubrivivax sp.]|jgi:hypothetical protein|nr:hypothetical protein [Rubrivivax sp.]